MSTPILDAKNLSMSFGGVDALVDVDVCINPGEIRCLVGENGSGKSTFVKIASGVYHQVSGTVAIDGHLMPAGDARAAIDAGVQVVFQDLSLFDGLSVAENIAFNYMVENQPRFVSRRSMKELAQKALDIIDVELDLEAPVSSLPMASKQIVAISRALLLDARLIFMDEPTAALTRKEVDSLLQIVLGLKERGISIVFISHKLDEVFSIADTITIFRDGRKVGDFEASSLTQSDLVYHMTGRRVEYPAYERQPRPEDGTAAPIVEVQGLSDRGHYHDVSFEIRAGDVLGLTGLLGAGRTAVALSLFGLNPPAEGSILLDAEEVQLQNPQDAVSRGIAFVSENRQVEGLFMEQSVEHNVSSTMLDTLVNRWHLSTWQLSASWRRPRSPRWVSTIATSTFRLDGSLAVTPRRLLLGSGSSPRQSC